MVDSSSESENLALWRYGIIASLLHRTEGSPSLKQSFCAMAARPYYMPDGREKHLSADTLRLWLLRYKQMGIAGLRNKVRKDLGKSAVPESMGKALSALRKANPLITVKRLLKEILGQGLWDGRKPSQAALYRFATANKLCRTDGGLPPESVRSFEYLHFGDLWSADFLHGPSVKEGQRTYKAYLHTIIDDATRLIVAARFYTAENTESLLSDLMLAICRFGIPRRFYTDNGAAFRSHHLQLVAAKMGIALPHTPPYKPQGRGKIERFFRSLRDGFLTGRQRTTLQMLNADLDKWVGGYQESIHSAIGMSPLNRKLTDQGQPLKRIDPTRNINDLFRMTATKKVGSDGCIRMWSNRFEVRDSFPGEAITIYYVPWDKKHILYGENRLHATLLDKHMNARRFDKPIRGIRNNPNNNEGEKP